MRRTIQTAADYIIIGDVLARALFSASAILHALYIGSTCYGFGACALAVAAR